MGIFFSSPHYLVPQPSKTREPIDPQICHCFWECCNYWTNARETNEAPSCHWSRFMKATCIHVDIQTMHAPSSVNYSPLKTKDTIQASLKWVHAKKLQEKVNSFLTYFHFNISKGVILPKCSTLMILMFTHEQVEDTWLGDQVQCYKLTSLMGTNGQTNLIVLTKETIITLDCDSIRY